MFEKSCGLGGRLAARRAEGTVLDHGSPAIATASVTALRRLADLLDASDEAALDRAPPALAELLGPATRSPAPASAAATTTPSSPAASGRRGA